MNGGGKVNKNGCACATARTAMRDHFIKESAFEDFPYPKPVYLKTLTKMFNKPKYRRNEKTGEA